MKTMKFTFRAMGLCAVVILITGCGGGKDSDNPTTSQEIQSGTAQRMPIPAEIQQFYDAKVSLPPALYEDLEAGRVTQEEIDQRTASGEFPKRFEFKTLDDLPSDLVWEDGMELEEFGSSEAKKGGTFYYFFPDFPRTLRVIGPDASSAFRNYLLDNVTLGLAARHPNNPSIGENGFTYYAELAKEWSLDKANNTAYIRLRPEATWSDGVPITVDDFFYSIYFHTSEHHQQPFYINYYNRNIVRLVKYDDYTFSITVAEQKPDFTGSVLALPPMPMHHYGVMDEDYIDKFQWVFQPTTGPYVIRKKDINKGNFIRLNRNDNWWAKDLKFQRYRYNFDVILISTIRDYEKAIEVFKKGEIDIFPINITHWWHEKVANDDPLVTSGYIHKYIFYNDRQRSTRGIWINKAVAPMDDINIRRGFQYSMNWGRVINEYNRGDYKRLNTVNDGYGPFSHPSLKARAFDVEKALEYFAKAGYNSRNDEGILIDENGETLRITLTTPWPSAENELTILQEEALKVGLDLNLDLLDFTTGLKKVNEKKHQVAYMGVGGGAEMTPRYWEYFHSKNAFQNAFLEDESANPERKLQPNTNNTMSVADPKMDKLIEIYRSSSSAEEMQGLSHQILEIIHEEAVFNPGYYRPHIRTASWRWVHWPEDHNVRIASNFEEFYLAWIDEDEKRETLDAMKKDKEFPAVIETHDQYLKAE